MTQTKLADRLGVSFASINRWENGQNRPGALALEKLRSLDEALAPTATALIAQKQLSPLRPLEFTALPEAVATVVEAHRLGFGHLFNPAFATEVSSIDPLPHQRIAVYDHMIPRSPLRFLLADDAGAGKTIMTGLYVREMLSRRLIRRILIVPPAGLVGNWKREMRTLFRLSFQIVEGGDARDANPFSGPAGDRVIVSVDSLAGERLFGRLQELREPYDLVVFDEAHKLSADQDQDLRIRKTDRYKLAEALAGIGGESPRWRLPWATQHLLLLTATPHMGKDRPYYFLWRLLLPDALGSYEAFRTFPREARTAHFIRRVKEEMVKFDGTPLYPQRNCDTHGYELSQGPGSEQELYDETTDYIRNTYNKANLLNRNAARLAMGVFQRRLASSTFALLRSFDRRRDKLQRLIDDIVAGKLSEEELRRMQAALDADVEDAFARGAEEDEGEAHEGQELEALGGTIARNLAELKLELERVGELIAKARARLDSGEDAKFEKLREVLRDPRWRAEKFIIFTEHRDTATFLARKLEALGFTDQVVQIHGGLDFRDREIAVERFRRPTEDGGAQYLIATDAAGEGINLQFCWLMVNYDIPWNPARLEQRMGRIHRYGQKRDPVIIVNLVATSTREGKVMATLLRKLEAIRKQLGSDKVYDVIGRLYSGVSLSAYFERAASGDADAAARDLDGALTVEQVKALEDREQAIYGAGGDVKSRLAVLTQRVESEDARRLMPGYVRRFVERAAPLLGIGIEGDIETGAALVPLRPGSLDALRPELERYTEDAWRRITVRKPTGQEAAIWLHPGEPAFDKFSELVRVAYESDAQRGAIFADPHAETPYLLHIARVAVIKRRPGSVSGAAPPLETGTSDDEVIEDRLVGLRQTADGQVEECSVEHLLLLRGAPEIAPGAVPLAVMGKGLLPQAEDSLRTVIQHAMVAKHRAEIIADLPQRLDFVARGFDHQAAELATIRQRLTQQVRDGETRLGPELDAVRERQRSLMREKEARLATLRAEPDLIVASSTQFIAHALVVPAQSDDERKRFDGNVEMIAMRLAMEFERERGAHVFDVSRPELARKAGLEDNPGCDVLSIHPSGEKRRIEVKGRAGKGDIEWTENELAKACNNRDTSWLYVVFECAMPGPRLVLVRDPWGSLFYRAKGSVVIKANEVIAAAGRE